MKIKMHRYRFKKKKIIKQPNKIYFLSKVQKKAIQIRNQIKIIFFIFFIAVGLLPLIKSLNKQILKKEEEINGKNMDRMFFNYFKSLKKISYNSISLLKEYRNRLLKIFSKNAKKNLTSIDNLYINFRLKFGNQLVLLNKVIFYCEILKCKKIFLSPYNNLYIKNKINDEKFNLTIEIAKALTDYNNKISTYYPHPYYYFLEIRPENKFYVFKNEILKNLPSVEVDENDLFIHIRSGDIFINPKLGIPYIQPPFCFYKEVIKSSQFNKIYIISENKLNPVINKLKREFPNIIFNENKLEIDISYLAHGYNVVASVSSFLIEIIKLNDNLRNYYEYDIYQLKEKIYHFHQSIYNFKVNYTIFLMESSNNYKKYMYIWRLTKKQINIMLRDKCPKNFTIIKPT